MTEPEPKHHRHLPPIYRLLAVFSGVPKTTMNALQDSGLWTQEEGAAISDHQRGLLRVLSTDGRIQWVTWGPDGPGYVLTGFGEAALDTYAQRYGPAHAPRRGPSLAEVARENLRRDQEQKEQPFEGQVR
ncbi:hypothetical protein [Deinococcus radiopugnans]|uniref:Uncharacterized protein n=1 Tax=Deinococcus radiopugnans ATCC 19172 TaxID=585398 RepID=A0A5C4Y7U4_9DEIO|nr:hypothetical protein [Deinococcus radiopugnans]MBB6016783.1 hypothetical protein [Deinococcus radiopugnans ATCC 19172]TNM71927.1 hypothetical protein FHR04_06045 [Deinococcus radiopugnans ATCC 19172]